MISIIIKKMKIKGNCEWLFAADELRLLHQTARYHFLWVHNCCFAIFRWEFLMQHDWVPCKSCQSFFFALLLWDDCNEADYNNCFKKNCSLKKIKINTKQIDARACCFKKQSWKTLNKCFVSGTCSIFELSAYFDNHSFYYCSIDK